MADSEIRTVRGMGGPGAIKNIFLKVEPAKDGGFVCEGFGGKIRGIGRTPELALEAAQEAQRAFISSDQMGGRGARQVTAEEIGYKP